ncbi:MAG: acetyl/propionyl-CoA carboxylase subunit alpha, partial [Actinomycetota bacterium]|nr:acetyl/propionyl-CoA carboxylase subunit alpha [Actinomycetota bacterium]
SPSPAVGEQMRARLATIATAAAQAVGYLGAGTVEMLMGGGGDPDRDSRGDPVYFLEMNTRLQVEHPVTELVTGLDLVRLQILVAQGEPLPPAALHPAMRGHAIEARLYAEDPEHDWRPSTGTLQLFEIGASPGVRVDSGVHSGIAVSPYYDPMLAKVICHAPSRAEAAATLAATLRRARIHGVVTNRDLLVRILGHEEFLAGATDTGFLERHDPATLGSALVDGPACALHAWAAVLAVQAENRQAARVLGGIPSGWRNNPSEPQSRHLRLGDRDIAVDYRFGRDGVTVVDVAIDGASRPDVSVVSVSPSSVVLDDGVRRSFAVRRSGDRVFVDSALGATDFVLDDRFPSTRNGPGAGSLVAPLPGEVVRLHVASGDAVAAGDPLVVIEAMKMEHTVGAQADGTVTQVLVAVGAQVEAGAVLAVVEGAGSGGGEAP